MIAAHSDEKKQAGLKPKHKRSLRNFAKLLHGLGVNISEHIETLELDEEELKQIRQRVGKETFLKPVDRTRMKQILGKAYDAMRSSVHIEDALWEDVAPFTFAAYQKSMFSHDLILLRAVREVHSGWYQKRASELKVVLPEARRFILASIANEHAKIFQQYPKFLGNIETVVSELLDLELKYEKSAHPLKEEFSELNKLLRKTLHEDAYFITKDIARIYDLRIEVYKWLVEADKESSPRILPNIEEELSNLLAARSYYADSYKEHLRNMSEIYLGKGAG